MAMAARKRVAAILDGNDARIGRSIAFAIQGLIVISAILVAVETLPNLPPWATRALAIEEALIVAVFTTEYALRLWSLPNRRRYMFGFWGSST